MPYSICYFLIYCQKHYWSLPCLPSPNAWFFFCYSLEVVFRLLFLTQINWHSVKLCTCWFTREIFVNSHYRVVSCLVRLNLRPASCTRTTICCYNNSLRSIYAPISDKQYLVFKKLSLLFLLCEKMHIGHMVHLNWQDNYFQLFYIFSI